MGRGGGLSKSKAKWSGWWEVWGAVVDLVVFGVVTALVVVFCC